MSKEVIRVMKKRMTLEERKRLCEICTSSYNLKAFKFVINTKMRLNDLLDGVFYWGGTSEGYGYWNKIKNRFTPEELSLTINLKEL